MSTTTATSVLPSDWSVADMLDHLGIPPERIRLIPSPGMATEQDVLDIHDHEGRICELVDGVLVEKPMGFYEARLAAILNHVIGTYLDEHDLGIVVGEAGFIRLLPKQVRAADLAFFRWEQFPSRTLPRERIPPVVPDLAVEVLSRSNTPAEMRRKLRDYFTAGVYLVWLIEPDTMTAKSYTSPEGYIAIDEDGVLSGGELLPGFELALRDLFSRAGRRAPESDQT